MCTETKAHDTWMECGSHCKHIESVVEIGWPPEWQSDKKAKK